MLETTVAAVDVASRVLPVDHEVVKSGRRRAMERVVCDHFRRRVDERKLPGLPSGHNGTRVPV